MSDTKQAVLQDWQIANLLIKDFNRDAALTPFQVAVVHFLALSKPGATASEIATEYEMQQAHSAKVIRALKESGHVHPIADERDGRVKHLYVTKKGAAVVMAVAKSRGHDLSLDDVKWIEPAKPKIRGS